MDGSFGSQPHGDRAFERHTRPDPRRYENHATPCIRSSIRAICVTCRPSCGRDSGANRLTKSIEVQHTDPAWRDRSNFIIAADVSSYSQAADREQLWARQLGDDRFEVCCIPFCLYDVALGDVVETVSAGTRKYMLNRVVEPSGRFVFRVWFGGSFHPRNEVEAELVAMGALTEWSSLNLLAVDASNASVAQAIADFLALAEGAGRLLYETGRSS